MADDLPRTHAAGVHRNDFVVETREAALVLSDQLRVEAGLAITRDLQLDLASIGNNPLLSITITPVAGLLAGWYVHSHGPDGECPEPILWRCPNCVCSYRRHPPGGRLIRHYRRRLRRCAGWCSAVSASPRWICRSTALERRRRRLPCRYP